MESISGETGLLAPLSLYTIDPNSWGKKSYALQQLGCGFPIRGDGLVATCKHVVDRIHSDRELLVAQHPTETVCHKVKKVSIHEKYDFAIVQLDCTFNVVPAAILGTLPLAVESFAYGYYDYTIGNGEISIIPQVFSGTITATPNRFKLPHPTRLPFYQLSFPCLKGFSGSPLYSEINGGNAISGMLIGNESSEIVERYVTESDTGEGKVIERKTRIFESGIAHTCNSMKSFASDLGFEIWN